MSKLHQIPQHLLKSKSSKVDRHRWLRRPGEGSPPGECTEANRPLCEPQAPNGADKPSLCSYCLALCSSIWLWLYVITDQCFWKTDAKIKTRNKVYSLTRFPIRVIGTCWPKDVNSKWRPCFQAGCQLPTPWEPTVKLSDLWNAFQRTLHSSTFTQVKLIEGAGLLHKQDRSTHHFGSAFPLRICSFLKMKERNQRKSLSI